VKAVFDMIAPAVGLSVGLAVGQTSIAAEAAELVEVSKKMVHSFGTLEHCQKANVASRVDILVATPGRLMDHFRSTPGFTIGDLQYLVVDETDRLLRQAYQDWLPNVLQVIQAPPVHEVANSAIKGSLKLGSVLTRRQW
jgi:ATP-dependent RNA helicase DDX51/DBP6